MIDIKFITEKEIPYPKLMDTADGNLLVLFEAACRGVVIHHYPNTKLVRV